MPCERVGGDASLEVLKQNAVVWRVVEAADTVRQLFNGEHVKAWEVCKGRSSCAVKYWSTDRLEEAATQVAAETQAMIKLKRSHGTRPLLVLPIQRFDNHQGGMFSISPYAGEVVSGLRAERWADICYEDLVQECQTMAVCLLLTQEMLEIEVKDIASGDLVIKQHLHKDIKPSNLCRCNKHGIYRLIDWGGFSSVDKQQWVDVCDLSYVTPEMAYYYENLGQYAAEFCDGLKEATNHTTDLYLMGLTIMEAFLGHLPRQIDCASYDHLCDYLEAVWNFSWEGYLQDVEMPSDMKEWLLWVLSHDPAERPQSAACAQAHRWIKQGIPRAVRALMAAEEPWKDLVEGIKMDLDSIIRGNSSSYTSSSSGSESSDSSSSSCCGYSRCCCDRC